MLNNVGRRTLHNEIVEAIRNMIVGGDLEPGQKIPEKDLCERFEISRTPLREALKALAGEGMVELLPQRGARVAILGEDELAELFPIIAALEGLAGELVCQRITQKQVDAIEDLHEQMVKAYEVGNRLDYSRLNRAIHMALIEATDNAALMSLYRSLELKIHNIRHTVRQLPGDWSLAMQEHIEILHALRLRDAFALAEVMKRHVLSSAQAVRHSVETIEAVPAVSATTKKHSQDDEI